MLTSISIQNFRSIRDASVKLGQVNLFIGPNNSGKSNFLKGIEFAAKRIADYPEAQELPFEWYSQSLPRGDKANPSEPKTIAIQLDYLLSENKFCEINLSIKGSYNITRHNSTKIDLKSAIVNNNFNTREELDLSTATPTFKAFPQGFYRVWEQLNKIFIYKIEPSVFELSTALSDQSFLSSNGQNIANFIYNLSQNNEPAFSKLKSDFARCVGTLISISVPPDPDVKGNLKLKFFNSSGDAFWAEEVSEGVLYFLALLCIVHQPDPPKLLLLEEPEKGIHPRRIREVMEFIFELARQRDIQIILTSHSPYVVDYFADIPDCISVFDRENGETVIRNAGDIITKTNAELEEKGYEPIHYTDALGEYWVSGFLGGVPEMTGLVS